MPEGIQREEFEPGSQPEAASRVVSQSGWHLRRVQKYGIELGGLVYAFSELLLEDGSGRLSGPGRNSIVKCLRDPFDPTRIFVVRPSDPTGTLIEVPICSAHRARAENRRTLNPSAFRGDRRPELLSNVVNAGAFSGASAVCRSAREQSAVSRRRILNRPTRRPLREPEPRSLGPVVADHADIPTSQTITHGAKNDE